MNVVKSVFEEFSCASHYILIIFDTSLVYNIAFELVVASSYTRDRLFIEQVAYKQPILTLQTNKSHSLDKFLQT